MDDTEPSRLTRWVGMVRIGLHRFWTAATATAPRQTAFSVLGIAVPVALMLAVTGVSVGLATGTTVASDDIDYWIVPESEASSAVVAVGGPQFGQVHPVAERLTAREDVRVATPVLLSLVRATDANRSEFVLAVGVVPPPTPIEVAGVSTAGLTPGDPHYANGTFNGTVTGEAVVSNGTATLLEADRGDSIELVLGSDARANVSVVNVSQTTASFGNLPVVVLQLSELQKLTGASDGDRADQLLVQTSAPGVRESLEAVYPRSDVIARGDIGTAQLFDSDLGLAMAVTGLLVAVIIGSLFAATTVGLAVVDDTPQRAMLAAIGVSRGSRATIIAVEALAMSLLGGLVGVGLGYAAIELLTIAARRYVAAVTVAEFRPWFVLYGLGIAALIGLVILPYLLYLSRETRSTEVLYD